MSTGNIAVVTGATGGIGFAVAQRLGKEGYTVILNGIEDDEGAKRVEQLTAEGITCEYMGFDVTDENAVNENIKAIGEKYGRIDTLVNNAGGLGGRSRFEEMTTEFYRETIHQMQDGMQVVQVQEYMEHLKQLFTLSLEH